MSGSGTGNMVANSTVVVQITNGDRVKQLITDLQAKMSQAQPGWESLLHLIHSTLQKDPDVVHLLKDEEIGVIVSGLQHRTGIVLAVEKSKPKKGEKIILTDL